MTLAEFWYGIITIVGVQVIIQLGSIIINNRNAKAQAPLTGAQAQEALSEAWEKLGQEYQRMLGNNKAQEDELASLRPLTLKIALQEQAVTQCARDKADWKRYAEKLSKQLEDAGILPLPFRRLPSDGDSEKVRAVTANDTTLVVKSSGS